jgi:hypothetical protein
LCPAERSIGGTQEAVIRSSGQFPQPEAIALP